GCWLGQREFPSQGYSLRAPPQRVPVFRLPLPMTLPEPSLLESARNCQSASPSPRSWIRHRHNYPLPRAAMAQRVFLLPLPRPFPPNPDRANRAPSPIPDAPAVENRYLPRSHPQVFRGGFRKLPLANRYQFAKVRDAPVLHPQN